RGIIWSFYSQGTREHAVSADLVMESSLRWLGNVDPVTLNRRQRGERLAELVANHSPFLLVLDGLEPLQEPPGYREDGEDRGGWGKDDSVESLLEQLAEARWGGLCVVTTRVPVAQLRKYERGPPRRSPVRQRELRRLRTADGTKLLKRHLTERPDGTLLEARNRPRERRAAVREVDGHPLAIVLLGTYIR